MLETWQKLEEIGDNRSNWEGPFQILEENGGILKE